MAGSPDAAKDRMIITAASAAFGPSLLALLGSLTLNWPGHPPVRVYDIGLDEKTLGALREARIEVVTVPPFCSHWRKHFTWKIWCWNDAPAREVLWMDAGLVVMQPLDEIFDLLGSLGYFVMPTYHLLTDNASEAACRGCRVDPEMRRGKMTLAGGLIGLRKEGRVREVAKEALAVALTEQHIASTAPMHRHDQAILSLLMYREFTRVVMADGQVYMGWMSPRQVPGQKVWVHRRKLLEKDRTHLTAHIMQPGEPFLPGDPVADRPFRTLWKNIFGTSERIIRRFLKGELGKEEIYDGVRK